MERTGLREQIPALNTRVYLNTGTSGPVPQSVFRAQVELLERFTTEGFSTPSVAGAYLQAIKATKEAVASLLNCDPSEVVPTQSTSDGISLVAQGLSWQPGDEIITSDLEHISGIAPWVDLAVRHGVKVVTLQSEKGHLEVEQFKQALTPRTKLICVSHISWATGTVLPLKEVCRIAREAGVLTLVDGAQSAGHIPVDVRDIDCDFYTVSGQKWLLGPEGTGALFVRQTALDSVAPTRIGWPSLASHDFPDGKLDFHPDVRRFESGTVHAPAYVGLTQAISLLQSIGLDEVFKHALKLSAMARDLLSGLDGVTVLSPPNTPSGLLTFAISGIDADECVQKLWQDQRVIIRSIPPLAALRASFHVFNTEDDVHALINAMKTVVESL